MTPEKTRKSKYNAIPEPLKLNAFRDEHKGNSSITVGNPQQGQTFVLSKSIFGSVRANLVAAACINAISIFGGL